VPAEDLPILFAGARLFAFPSLYEGFGLPVLEAMSSGVPVVCSNNSSLLEVAGDAALMCEAMDVETLAQHMARALEDADWRAVANQRGLAHAGRFSWDRCAAQTLVTYRKVLESR
jgi:glycosyltransferase involved in cell wall biosynthesis